MQENTSWCFFLNTVYRVAEYRMCLRKLASWSTATDWQSDVRMNIETRQWMSQRTEEISP